MDFNLEIISPKKGSLWFLFGGGGGGGDGGGGGFE